MESKKEAGVAILVSDKMDFKSIKIKREKEGHYLMVKGLIDISGRANDPKYICTQFRSAQIHKASS